MKRSHLCERPNATELDPVRAASTFSDSGPRLLIAIYQGLHIPRDRKSDQDGRGVGQGFVLFNVL